MGAPVRLGRGAAKKFGNVFWTAFLDNSSFFTSGNTNYTSGSTTNLGTDGVGLGLGVKACRLMTSPSADGTKRVGAGFTPTILLAPPELETVALQLYGTSNLGYVAVSSANVFANRYRPVIQNRLSDSAFTGYSTTAWYLIGPTVKPMLVTFLNGNQTPIVESTDADFDTLGIQFRGYHDFGCDKSEYLSALKVKGAA
jgi:phage major head subunit gpT-like protein